jgi:hypothetical protein
MIWVKQLLIHVGEVCMIPHSRYEPVPPECKSGWIADVEQWLLQHWCESHVKVDMDMVCETWGWSQGEKLYFFLDFRRIRKISDKLCSFRQIGRPPKMYLEQQALNMKWGLWKTKERYTPVYNVQHFSVILQSLWSSGLFIAVSQWRAL